MWKKVLLLLLHCVEAAPAVTPCQQGGTFSEAALSPAAARSTILRVPGARSLSECVSASCELGAPAVAWLFRGRCYTLRCPDCHPRRKPGPSGTPPPQALVPEERRWRTSARTSGAPGDQEAPEGLEALQDLSSFAELQQEFAGGGGVTNQTEMPPNQATSPGGRELSQSEFGAEAGPTQIPWRGGGGAPGSQPLPRKPASASSPQTAPPFGPARGDPPSGTAAAAHDTGHTPGPASTLPPNRPPPWSPTTDSAPARPGSKVTRTNHPPVAFAGPDRTLLLPVESLLLNGSGSTDDQAVVSFHWEPVSGPPGLKLEGTEQAIAMATGLQAGHYVFRLTVADRQGAADSCTLRVWVQDPGAPLDPPPARRSPPPVAHASGSHTLTLPNNSLVLRGSVTEGDQGELHFLWVRDSQSPAAGDVLYGSDTQPSLYLSNLVEGTYLFQLRVTDAQGRSSVATATVEVRPEPGGGQQVELEMMVSVSQVSVAQRDTVVRQLAALLHVLDRDIQVRALLGHSHLSSVLRFSVRGPSGPVPGSRLVGLLRNQLLRDRSDYLLFPVLRVDTVLCQLRCSGRGQCDPITKLCACDPFWTENPVRRYLGDGEKWRVLYVILTSFALVVFILSLGWTFICCCKSRTQTRTRRRTRYTILDNMDEQERLELRPRFSLKHRSTQQNSSLMMSESELDSESDGAFDQGRAGGCNGNAFG